MTKNVTMPNGDVVGFPDDMADDQIKGMIQKKFPNAGNTRGGDLARGLAHGVASGIGLGGLVGPEPSDESGWRETGETIGSAAPATIGGFLVPEALGAKAAYGGITGALQPASGIGERAENALIGAGSAFGAGRIARMSPRAKSGLNHLAEMAAGYALGAKAHHPFSAYGGAAIGHFAGRELERVFGGGLADLVAYIAKNPGLAAYLGIKASPYLGQAGEYVGEQLGQPSE